MLIKKLFYICIIFYSTCLAASNKYLIKMPGMKPEIAKTFVKKGNNFEFTVAKNTKIKKGKKTLPVDFEMIKLSLEKRLKKYKVSIKGNLDKGIISFSGDESKFLKSLSRARIKPAPSSFKIAATSSVSDGGIRARTSVRGPKNSEVRGVILTPGSPATVLVNSVGKNWTDKISKKPTKFDLGSFQAKQNQTLYLTPTSMDQNSVWQTKFVKDK